MAVNADQKAGLRPLHKAVAHFLFLASKEVPDEKAALYRATALALINEPVAAGLLQEAMRQRSNDQPLYDRSDIREGPSLADVWEKSGGRVQF